MRSFEPTLVRVRFAGSPAAAVRRCAGRRGAYAVASCGRYASSLPEAHRGARPAACLRTEGCERILAVQFVKLHELLGDLVAEGHRVLREAPARAGSAAALR